MHIDILLITYNRPRLLAHTLKSLAAQTYTNFTVHLLDNGSQPPVDPNIIPIGLDVRLKRYETNQHQNHISNATLAELQSNILQSNIISCLADDDAWAPHTLEIVATLFAQNPDMEMLGLGYSNFDHDTSQTYADNEHLSEFSGQLERFDAREVGLGTCNLWGIGQKSNYKTPRKSHPSAAFLSAELIKRTTAHQNEFFIMPFGDVSYVGACFNTQYVYYLDLPLVVMGSTAIREGNGDKPGGRQHWQREVKYLEYTPLRACSFANMAVEAHLKVLHRNKVCQEWDCTLRSDFFAHHIAQIASDAIVTEQTMRDLEEVLPFAIGALIRENGTSGEVAQKTAATECLLYIKQQLQYYAFQRELGQEEHKAKLLAAKKTAVTHPDIFHYATWLERNIVLPKLGLVSDVGEVCTGSVAAAQATHAN